MGCLSCLKGFLIFMDVIYGLTGAAVLALGILWFFRDNILSSAGLDKDDLNAVLNGGGSDLAYIMQIAAIVFLVVGSVIILSSIVLCVATCKMDSCCFALFLVPLFLVMLLNFAIGALIIIEAKPFIGSEGPVRQNILDMLQNDDYLKNGTYTTMGEAWNILQSSNITTDLGGCCGVSGPADYLGSKFQQNNADMVPVSCCALRNSTATHSLDFVPSDAVNYGACNAAANDVTCTAESCTDPTGNLYTEGCINHTLYTIIYDIVVVSFSIFFAWGGWEFLMFILGILVCCFGRQEK